MKKLKNSKNWWDLYLTKETLTEIWILSINGMNISMNKRTFWEPLLFGPTQAVLKYKTKILEEKDSSIIDPIKKLLCNISDFLY